MTHIKPFYYTMLPIQESTPDNNKEWNQASTKAKVNLGEHELTISA